MLVNLPNGKTVDMSFEDYLRAGKEEYNYLMSINLGADMEDPFFGSAIHGRQQLDDEEESRFDTGADEDANDYFEDDVYTTE